MLIIIICEGALRKWALPGQIGNFAYFAKDVLAVLFVFNNPLPRANVWALRARTALLGLGVILIPWAFVGLTISPIAAVLTLKHIIVWPLFAIHAVAHAPKIRMEVIDRLLLCGALLNAGLGLIQSHSSAGAWVNKLAWQNYAGMEDTLNDAAFGTAGYVRSSGTFSYLSGLASFSQFLVLFLLSRISASKSWLPPLTLIAGCLCGVTTGSRSALAFAAVGLIAFPFLSRSTQILKMSALVIVAAAVLLSGPLRPTTEAFWERWQNSDSVEGFSSRAIPDFAQVADIMLSAPFGDGLGTESQWGSFDRASKGNNDEFAEDRVVRLASEIGALLIPVTITLSLIPLRLLNIALRKSTHASATAIPILGLLYAILNANAFFDHVAAALWWTALPLCAATLNTDGGLRQKSAVLRVPPTSNQTS